MYSSDTVPFHHISSINAHPQTFTRALAVTAPSFLSLICNCQLARSALKCRSVARCRRSRGRHGWSTLSKVVPAVLQPHQRRVIIPMSRRMSLSPSRKVLCMSIAIKQLDRTYVSSCTIAVGFSMTIYVVSIREEKRSIFYRL